MKLTTAAGAALLIFSLHAQTSTTSLPVTEATDGYHVLGWLGSSNLSFYNEWWYFNVYDTANNVQAIFTYQVVDPLSVLQGGGELSTAVYTPSGIVVEGDPYLTLAFSANPFNANVTLGKKNTITVIDASTYQITGATKDGKVAWNLQYQRTAPSWYGLNRSNVASQSWELMSWLIYMPAASVTGTLTVNGTTYQVVNAAGYHDHNWGEWNFETVSWNWAQVSQTNLTPALTFDLGDFPGTTTGVASVEVNGVRYVFQKDQYTLTHTQWAIYPPYNVSYPTQSVFTADNGTAQINLTMNVSATEGLATESSPPELVIFEQTATYSGQVTVGTVVTNIENANGFKEYATIVQ